jgi:hypothetical protein
MRTSRFILVPFFRSVHPLTLSWRLAVSLTAAR